MKGAARRATCACWANGGRDASASASVRAARRAAVLNRRQNRMPTQLEESAEPCDHYGLNKRPWRAMSAGEKGRCSRQRRESCAACTSSPASRRLQSTGGRLCDACSLDTARPCLHGHLSQRRIPFFRRPRPPLNHPSSHHGTRRHALLHTSPSPRCGTPGAARSSASGSAGLIDRNLGTQQRFHISISLPVAQPESASRNGRHLRHL